MECPQCQRSNESDARFCEDCGSKLSASCRSCGRELKSAARFCPGCGESVVARAAEAVQAAADRPAARQAPTSRSGIAKHLADRILVTRSALEGERKQVTVLFADVKGSMELAEQLDTEEWSAIMQRFFRILSDGVERYEGFVDKFTGDGIMALFGAPIAHEDHARRACYAARQLYEDMGAAGVAAWYALDRGH